MRLAFDVSGPVQVSDMKVPSTWEGVPLNEIAVRYKVSERQREEERDIEGVLVHVFVGDTPQEDHTLLSDLVRLAELQSGHASVNELVELTFQFIEKHGPLTLCDEHGRGSAHDAFCDTLLPGRERVGHVLNLAEQCRAALMAVGFLRKGEPIPEAEEATLELRDPPPLRLASETMRPEDRRKLEKALANPIVRDWRRLEGHLARLRADATESLGCLPTLLRQLTAACQRDGRRRVCKNPDCDNDFIPTSPRRRYCDGEDCKRSRGLQRQLKMFKCPKCGRRLGEDNEECLYCGTLLPEGKGDGRA